MHHLERVRGSSTYLHGKQLVALDLVVIGPDPHDLLDLRKGAVTNVVHDLELVHVLLLVLNLYLYFVREVDRPLGGAELVLSGLGVYVEF